MSQVYRIENPASANQIEFMTQSIQDRITAVLLKSSSTKSQYQHMNKMFLASFFGSLVLSERETVLQPTLRFRTTPLTSKTRFENSMYFTCFNRNSFVLSFGTGREYKIAIKMTVVSLTLKLL